jgi:hypothetical protein
MDGPCALSSPPKNPSRTGQTVCSGDVLLSTLSQQEMKTLPSVRIFFQALLQVLLFFKSCFSAGTALLQVLLFRKFYGCGNEL